MIVFSFCHRRHWLPFVLLASLFGTEYARAQSNALKADSVYARNLLNAFHSFCPTNGNWSDHALEASKKLQNVLTSIIEDPACVDIASSISRRARVISEALTRFRNVPIERDILAKKRQQRNLLLLTMGEGVSDLDLARYQGLLRENQLSLLNLESYLPYDEERADREYITNVVVNSTYELFNQASLNQKCLFRSPMFLSAISSLGSSVSASLLSGGQGLAYASLSSVLGHALEFIRVSSLRRKIQELGQVEYISSYQCVLESISNQWCDAKESLDLINLKIRNDSTETGVLRMGTDLLDRDLPLLTDWLEKVAAATPPENTAIARRQSGFLEKEKELRKWYLESIAKLNEERENIPLSLNSEAEREKQFRLLHKLVVNIASIR
ncbi:MAG: hypothetical protein OXB88_08875, partial [Bacteriovoracales bacterium]|nr:hypothetical protein [Bacteriovoracales bacterium]